MVSVFQSIGRIVYGSGAAAKIGAEAGNLGCKRVLIITDKGLTANNIHKAVQDPLEAAGISTAVFSDVVLDPTLASIEESAKAALDFGADCLVGLGGGSALDSAKATALRCRHPGPLERYFGVNLVPSACLPTILIPTTAGTGSEMTSISVLADASGESKKGIVSDYLYAKAALLDPDLTLTLPPYHTAITGLDSFVHAMESFVNLTATPFTDALNRESMRIIAANIRKAYANGSDIRVREQMLYASALSGMGFSNTQNGVIHALGMAIPTRHHLPHGLLIAALAPMGIAFNAMASPEKYAEVAEILGSAPAGADTLTKAKSAAQGFMTLLEDLEIKAGLQAHGVSWDDLAGTAERAAGTARLMGNNPRKGSAKDLLALLQQNF